jgi:hypothetical protein
MAEPARNLGGLPEPPVYVEYADPSGGLNTKRDVHALERNMLAVSINGWPAYDNVIAKRPASSYYVTANGATGMGGTGTTIVATRWTLSGNLTTTVLLAQNGTKLAFAQVGASSWTNITTAMGTGAQRIHVAQMYDPTSGANTCFICNGVDVPWMWQGPGHTTLTAVSTAAGYLPQKLTSSSGITPRFVTTVSNNSVLVYSGESTAPTAVYVSNAFYPQQFSQSATTSTAYPGSYQPYLVGFNDGVGGGNVTGITSLQGNIIVFKESAIYRGQFTSVYSSVYGFQFQCVSVARGMVAPESLAAFDTYLVFLSNDGVYYTDGYVVMQISASVPTFFDSSLNGYGALCLAYTTAVGVRIGSRYLIFYDRGLPNNQAAAGYPTAGVWFDFAKPDDAGNPQAGEIHGALSQYPFSAAMTVAGAAQLNGPYDNDLFVWTSATADQVAIFGSGFVEFGGAITTTFAGPADRFPQIARESAFFDYKHLHSARFAIAAALSGAPLTFTAVFTTDFLLSTSAAANTQLLPGGGAVFGTGVFGTNVFGGGTNATIYAPVTIVPSKNADGRVIQTLLTETSTTEWILLGYVLEISRRLPVR